MYDGHGSVLDSQHFIHPWNILKHCITEPWYQLKNYHLLFLSSQDVTRILQEKADGSKKYSTG